MSQKSPLTQSAHSVRQVLTAYITTIPSGWTRRERCGHIRERVAVLVLHDEASVVVIFDRPGRWEAAGLNIGRHTQHLNHDFYISIAVTWKKGGREPAGFSSR
jgi:hypothetical protein